MSRPCRSVKASNRRDGLRRAYSRSRVRMQGTQQFQQDKPGMADQLHVSPISLSECQEDRGCTRLYSRRYFDAVWSLRTTTQHSPSTRTCRSLFLPLSVELLFHCWTLLSITISPTKWSSLIFIDSTLPRTARCSTRTDSRGPMRRVLG